MLTFFRISGEMLPNFGYFLIGSNISNNFLYHVKLRQNAKGSYQNCKNQIEKTKQVEKLKTD